ncbi:MAG: hypothetical protein L3K14_02475 [Thermoplasmata archaeon]|nr:hypothetical protein [Thermoplasmata archaeon]
MPTGFRWAAGRDDLVPFLVMAVPMVVWALVAADRSPAELALVVAAVGLGLTLKRLLPLPLEDLAVVPPVVTLLVEASAFALTIDGLLLASLAGVGLLLWVGSEPRAGVTLSQQLEPALVPALAVGVAVAVLFFLPGDSGGQVGLAALVLVGVLALSAWLYLRSADELRAASPTS